MTELEIADRAAFALGEMLQKDASVETAVRWTLRIATLKNQLQWQMWSLMNLTTFTVEMIESEHADQMDPVIQPLFDAFPTEKDDAVRQTAFDNVNKAYMKCRRIGVDGALMTDAVGMLEAKCKDQHRAFMENWTPKGVKGLDDVRNVLNLIKNDAQRYLTSVEGRVSPPTWSGAITNEMD